MVKREKLQNNKPIMIALIAMGVAIIILIIFLIIALSNRASTNLSALPAPEVASGVRGEEFNIDKNINESTIDQYLGRSDVVYRDLRMMVDPGNYSAIGGDSYLSGYIDGFEITPLPYILAVENLPEAVGSTYTGPTLFSIDDDGNYIPNYEESYRILEDLFPDDKTIFLMCGGGGYADEMHKLLSALGWDDQKIYNVGGYWNYDGENKIEVKYDDEDYAFWKIPYHQIDFSKLHEKSTAASSDQSDSKNDSAA